MLRVCSQLTTKKLDVGDDENILLNIFYEESLLVKTVKNLLACLPGCLPVYLPNGGAATHRSGNSSKRQLIEAATHRTPLGGPFHRMIFM
jgi:hypothetical protein